jgi:hypothetical protein
MIDFNALDRAMDISTHYGTDLVTTQDQLNAAQRDFNAASTAGDQTGMAVHGQRVAELRARVDGLLANPPPPAATIYANLTGQTLNGNLV